MCSTITDGEGRQALDGGSDSLVTASTWGRSRGSDAAVHAAGAALVATCLAVLGLLLGAPLGMLAGALWARLAGTGEGHGQGDLLILVTFGPLGALGGGAALPAFYLVRLLRKRWRGRSAAGERLHPGTRGSR